MLVHFHFHQIFQQPKWIYVKEPFSHCIHKCRVLHAFPVCVLPVGVIMHFVHFLWWYSRNGWFGCKERSFTWLCFDCFFPFSFNLAFCTCLLWNPPRRHRLLLESQLRIVNTSVSSDYRSALANMGVDFRDDAGSTYKLIFRTRAFISRSKIV